MPSKISISKQGYLTTNKLNWALIFTAAFFYHVNLFTSITIFPTYALAIGSTPLQSGLQNTVFFITAICLRFYFGPLADRRGRKLPLMMGTFIFATTPLLLLASPTVTMLFVARIYQAFGLSMFIQSCSSLIADLSPEGQRGRYLGIYRFLATLSVLLGAPTALALVETAGYQAFLIASCIIGLAGLLALFFVKAPKIIGESDQLSSTESILTVLRNKAARPVFAGIAMLSISYSAILTYLLIYLSDLSTLSNPGVYFTIFGLVGLGANLLGGNLSDRFGRPAIAWPALIILAIGNILLIIAPVSPAYLFLSSILAGVGVYAGLLVFSAWLIDISGLRVRATMLSMQENIIDLSFAGGAFFTGLVGGWLGLGTAFSFIGLMILVPAALMLSLHLASKQSN